MGTHVHADGVRKMPQNAAKITLRPCGPSRVVVVVVEGGRWEVEGEEGEGEGEREGEGRGEETDSEVISHNIHIPVLLRRQAPTSDCQTPGVVEIVLEVISNFLVLLRRHDLGVRGPFSRRK